MPGCEPTALIPHHTQPGGKESGGMAAFSYQNPLRAQKLASPRELYDCIHLGKQGAAWAVGTSSTSFAVPLYFVVCALMLFE